MLSIRTASTPVRVAMNVRWLLRHYRTWVLMTTVLAFTSMTVLTNMLQQLPAQVEPPHETRLRVGDERNQPDAHVRSIRNYQQVPREKFKILQLLQPIYELESSIISQDEQKGKVIFESRLENIPEHIEIRKTDGVRRGNVQVQQIFRKEVGNTNKNAEHVIYEQQEGGPNYYEDNLDANYKDNTDDDVEDDIDDEDDTDENVEEELHNAQEGPENPEFQPGDFGEAIVFQRPLLKFEDVRQTIQTSANKNNNNLNLIEKEKHLNMKTNITVILPGLQNFNNDDDRIIIPKLISSHLHSIGKQKRRKLPGLVLSPHLKNIHRKQSTMGLIDPPYTDGIYWASTAEHTVPAGLSLEESERLLHHLRSQPVHFLKPPQWNRCGRPMNGFVHLADGTPVCARYRTPHNKLILGEVLSFHLSQLLGMDNIPSVVLSWVNATSPQWKGINYTSLNWQNNQVVALIDWIQDLNTQGSQVRIPKLIHKAYLSGSPLTPAQLSAHQLSQEELSQLVQWGDMIIFDYLTGNYDRFASMQDAAEKDNKPSIIEEHVRNLKKSDKNGKLWLIDNESGLFDAYDLLYMDHKGKFLRFHHQMLQTMCVFRKKLIEKLQVLKESVHPDRTLMDFTRSKEALLESIPKDSRDKSYNLFETKFAERLKEVSEWEEKCRGLSQR